MQMWGSRLQPFSLCQRPFSAISWARLVCATNGTMSGWMTLGARVPFGSFTGPM
jgi:hypothetical protein